MKVINFFLFFILSLHILGCAENTTYSGKIINEKNLTDIKITNKEELIKKFGQPSFIDEIQNKLFYYTEKSKSKNFYNNKTEYSYLFVFELDKNDKILKTESINLLNNKKNKFQTKITENNIVEKGLIEKIFGGVGPNNIPNSP